MSSRGARPIGVIVLAVVGCLAAVTAQVGVPAIDPRRGVVVEHDNAGATDEYSLTLEPAQFVDLTLTDNSSPRSVTPPQVVTATVRDRAGTIVARVTHETSASGDRRLCFVAERAGVHTVAVSATRPLRYTLRVADVRAATGADRNRSAALADFVEAERLHGERSNDRDREAIGRFLTAASLWTQAGDGLEAAHAWHRVALVYNALADTEKALDADSRAAQLGRELGDRQTEAVALTSKGITYIRMGDHPNALRQFEPALALFRAAGDRDSEAYTLTAMGVIYQLMGDARKALEYHPQAIANWRAVGNAEGEAVGVHNRGTALRLSGNFKAAMPVLEEALRMQRALGHRVFAAAALAQIGHTFLGLGDVAHAFGAYEEALALQRTIGIWRGEWAGSSALGMVAQRGDWPAAVELFSAGAAIFQGAERAFEARIFHAPRRVESPPDAVRRGIDMLMRARIFLRAIGVGRWSAVVDTAIANGLALLGDIDGALPAYTDALATFRAIRDRDGEVTALVGLAFTEKALGRLEDARNHAEAAVRVVESFQADVLNPEVRALYMSRNRYAFGVYIDIEMALDAVKPGRGHAAAALLASERARARGLVDLLWEARSRISAGVNTELVARERLLANRVDAADDELSRLLSGRTPSRVTEAQRHVDDLTAELRAVQHQLTAESPQYAALTQPSAMSLADIQELLDPDTVLLEYALGDVRSYVWAVTRDTVTTALLPGRAAIEDVAGRAYELLMRGPRRDTRVQTRRALEALSNLVLKPVAPALTSRRLVVVADAGLQYVPFAALPRPAASADDPPGEPLIVTHELVMLPSASALDALRRTPRAVNRANRELVILADPVLRPDDPRLRRAAAPPGRSAPVAAGETAADPSRPAADDDVVSLDRLPFTRAEANAIAALAPGPRTLKALDFAASRATAVAEIGRFRLVHFATHALLNSTQPERSGIVLSLVDRGGAPVDGFLRLHDIYNLRLSADLVVLSACRTALGKELRGEGLVGLTRGFFYAGAPAVVASLWDVRDRSTAELMTRFYRAMLRDRLAPAAALRAAQLGMWRDVGWSAPAHWAGFVLQGDWRDAGPMPVQP
jgi:CHAT domain-containing protein/tetratricopeptide (TPR) repeat protein